MAENATVPFWDAFFDDFSNIIWRLT
jgi:hypothetical protein